MIEKVIAFMKRNRIILFSFAAVVTFSFALVVINIENFTLIDKRTIIISGDVRHDPVHDPVPAPEPATQIIPHTPVPPAPTTPPVIREDREDDSIPIPLNKHYAGSLKKSEASKLYSFVMNEPGIVNIIFTNTKPGRMNVSAFIVDVLNSEKVSMIKGGRLVSDSAKTFETGDIHLEAGKYFIRISHGSVYNSGSYRLWIRH